MVLPERPLRLRCSSQATLAAASAVVGFSPRAAMRAGLGFSAGDFLAAGMCCKNSGAALAAGCRQNLHSRARQRARVVVAPENYLKLIWAFCNRARLNAALVKMK